MPFASVLLRVVLMLSLLLNGLNAAVAGEYPQRATTPAATDVAPPCHGHDAMAMGGDAAVGALIAAGDDGHCRIKDCLRTCAQQPLLGAATLPPLHAPWFTFAPPAKADRDRPAPALPRIQRPPIG